MRSLQRCVVADVTAREEVWVAHGLEENDIDPAESFGAFLACKIDCGGVREMKNSRGIECEFGN